MVMCGRPLIQLSVNNELDSGYLLNTSYSHDGNWEPSSMRTASFWLNHPEGKSRALAEFAIHKNKVYLNCLMFVHGNVVDMFDYAACKRKAALLLSDPYFSPTG